MASSGSGKAPRSLYTVRLGLGQCVRRAQMVIKPGEQGFVCSLAPGSEVIVHQAVWSPAQGKGGLRVEGLPGFHTLVGRVSPSLQASVLWGCRAVAESPWAVVG